MANARTNSRAESTEKHDTSPVETELVQNEYLHMFLLIAEKSPEELKQIEKRLEVKLDYASVLGHVDALLHKLRETIDSIEPHEPLPVRLLEARACS